MSYQFNFVRNYQFFSGCTILRPYQQGMTVHVAPCRHWDVELPFSC